MTVRQAAAASTLTKEDVEQVICELVSMKLISVHPPAEKTATDDGFPAELERIYAVSDTADYYELLGVEPETPRMEMRNRYFELSKKFHPDKAFGKANKSEKEKMTLVFQRLTVAYDVLSNAKRRAEYNATIADILELRAIEKNLNEAVRGSRPSPPKPAESEHAAAAPPPSSKTQGEPVADVSTAPVHRVSLPPKYVPSTPPKLAESARREEIRRRRAGQAVADLLRRRSDNPVPAPENGVEKQLGEVERALSEQRFADALTMCRTLLNIDPKNTQVQGLLKTATVGQGKAQAQANLRRGLYAVREGQVQEAKWYFEQAASQDKDNVEARHLLAELLLQHEHDCVSALVLMKEVIVLGGQRARYFATLGDVFLGMKDYERATDAYNKAMRLEPDNKDLKKKLRLCKK